MSTGPLTFGQLSVWRDIEALPAERWHEPNSASYLDLPSGTTDAEVGRLFTALDAAHPGMRTVIDTTDRSAPRQVLLDPLDRLRLAEVDDGPGLLESLRSVPFELERERPWRVLAVRPPPGAAAGRARRLAFVQHHMCFDVAAHEVLRADLRAMVGEGRSPEPSADLVDLAREQRSEPVWLRRAEATRRHLAAVYEQAPAEFAGRGPQHGPVILTLTSRRLRLALAALAARAGTGLADAVVAGAVVAARGLTDDQPLVVGLMASNRYSVRWERLITSMNQWIPIRLAGRSADSADSADLADVARAVAGRTLRAYRLAMYDVDDVRDVGPRSAGLSPSQRPSLAVNVVDTADVEAPHGDYEQTAEVRREPVLCAAGPRAYLRVAAGPDRVQLVLRTTGLPPQVPARLLRRVYEVVTGTGPPGPAAVTDPMGVTA
jgi:hypothetical protein